MNNLFARFNAWSRNMNNNILTKKTNTLKTIQRAMERQIALKSLKEKYMDPAKNKY